MRLEGAGERDVTGHDAPGSPWRTLGAREVYRNPWLEVVEYSVVRPDGERGIYGVVNPGDNASIVALDGDQNLYLVGDFCYPLQRYQWSIPSGKVEHGEEPAETARRELAEEAGITAARWDLLGTFDLTPGICTQASYIYLARDLTLGEARPEGTERFTLRRLPLREAYEACLSGEIRNSVSVLGILRTQIMLA
ncbi:MAG TPA: NUDIX hydrolase [Ktedonobacterales bacterium]|jgi:8-oxo-dGDP phosphatase|nr:NUDIX hydrolase [Ktedonobacterales bacterium]